MFAKNLIRYLYILVGSIFLVIGIIGIFLPLLPTTPFLILTAICYDRGSPHFHSWLMNHKIFGPPIHDWRRSRVIRTKFKVFATAMILITVVFVLPKETIPIYGKATYVIFIAGLLTFIWSQKSKP